MLRVRFVCLLLSICCLLGLTGSALAAEVDCDATYCFTSEDFSTGEQPLAGICITQLPEAASGTVMLGTRVLQKGKEGYSAVAYKVWHDSNGNEIKRSQLCKSRYQSTPEIIAYGP